MNHIEIINTDLIILCLKKISCNLVKLYKWQALYNKKYQPIFKQAMSQKNQNSIAEKHEHFSYVEDRP